MKEKIRQALAARTRLIVHDGDLKESAVLVPIFIKDGRCHIVFTQRTNHLEHHKGQISFPGGGRHTEDADLQVTALRESREEIGLKEEDVEVLGALDDAVTVTSRYRITPFVGLIPYPYQFIPEASEVQEIFTLPLDDLMHKAKITIDQQVFNGQTIEVHTYETGGRIIWGATAWILSRFLEIIRPINGAHCKS
jgi:8-oxo-dGTP pyrophosphatase MutT (NUDIX family)